MKKNIHKNLLGMLKNKGFLVIASSVLLVSCGTQMGGYSETDGVYYDPDKDTLPQGSVVGNEGNRMGEYYDYQDSSDIIKNANANEYEQQNRYDDWNNLNVSDSDWGSFSGSTVNYYDHSWGWGSPWGWYGYGYPYGGWRGGWNLGFSWGWGSYWGNSWGSPWGGWYGYNPYWGYYDPYWGGYYGGYYPYYGYGYNTIPYKRSGVVSQRNYGSANGNKVSNSSGFRNNANTDFRNNVIRNNNRGFRNPNFDQNPNGTRPGGFRNPTRNPNNNGTRPGGFRNDNYRPRPQQQQSPNYNTPRNDGGFRSGGSNSGGFRSGGSSSSGGGMRSSGGGGFRSGGR